MACRSTAAHRAPLRRELFLSPGRGTVREVLTLIQQTGGTLVGAHIVEYNPKQDLSRVTAIVAAELVKEVAGRFLA